MRTHRYSTALVSTLILVAVRPADAEDRHWLGGFEQDQWNTAENWLPAATPTSSDVVHINNGGQAQIGGQAWCESLLLGEAATDSGQVQIVGEGAALNTYRVTIGELGIGRIEQSSGISAVGWVRLGLEEGSEGFYLMTDGKFMASGLDVGVKGKGVFREEGGFVQGWYADINIGVKAGSEGILELAGAARIDPAYNLNVGVSGRGTLQQRGSTRIVAGGVAIGLNAGSTGLCELAESAGLSATDSLIVGVEGNGTLLQNAGNITAQTVAIGRPGEGTFIQNGGTTSSDSMVIGGYRIDNFSTTGTGRYVQNAGDARTTNLTLGAGVGSRGYYELHDTAYLESKNVLVGDAGQGSFIQTGGIHDATLAPGPNPWSSPALVVGNLGGADGTYRLEAGQLNAGHVTIGYFGKGTFSQTGGSFECTTLRLGSERGSEGRYELSGTGNLTVSSQWPAFQVGINGKGVFVQNGGSHNIRNIELGCDPDSEGTFEFGAPGELKLDSLSVGIFGTGIVRQTNGTYAPQTLQLPAIKTGKARYELAGGRLTAGFENLGFTDAGTPADFIHTGGENSAYRLNIYSGTYSLSGDGVLATTHTILGPSGNVSFTQTGGTHQANINLSMSAPVGSSVSYNISGGRLTASTLSLGPQSELRILDRDASIQVISTISIDSAARLTAVPGSTIQLKGRFLRNLSQDPDALVGLGNLTLLVDPPWSTVTELESAGTGIGGDFSANFALAGLLIGTERPGRVLLRDDADNGHRSAGSEAFYTRNLLINPGSTLNLNGLGLFVEGNAAAQLDTWIADGRLSDSMLTPGLRLDAIFDTAHNWTTISTVPEPASVVLCGIAVLLASRQGRRQEP